MVFDAVFAALEPSYGQSILRVENLKLAVPDVLNGDAIAQSKKLQGTFEYTRNGQAIITTIARVALIEEATRPGMPDRQNQESPIAIIL